MSEVTAAAVALLIFFAEVEGGRITGNKKK